MGERVSYFPTNSRGRALQAKAQKQQQQPAVAGTFDPDMSGASGSWWVPGATSASEQPDAATTSTPQVRMAPAVLAETSVHLAGIPQHRGQTGGR